ncbi:MAG: sugar transferase, partial [Ferruginibacter sp.]
LRAGDLFDVNTPLKAVVKILENEASTLETEPELDSHDNKVNLERYYAEDKPNAVKIREEVRILKEKFANNAMNTEEVTFAPQFLNILIGNMSFVGPRPERPEFVEQLNEAVPFYNERHIIKPGLTGWAQINYPYGASITDAKEKLQFDLFYIKNQSSENILIGIGCEADNGRFWGGITFSVLSFVIFWITGYHLILLLANFPLIYIGYKFFLRHKVFITIEILKH